MLQVLKSPWFWASLAITAVPVGITAGIFVASGSLPPKPTLTISASAVLSGALGLLLKSGDFHLARRKDDREELGSARATLAERDEVNSRILQLEKDWPNPDERSPSARIAISDAEERHAVLSAVYQQSRLAATAHPGPVTAEGRSESTPPARREALRQLLRDSALAEPTLDALGWFTRGNAAYEAGQYDEALTAYDRALILRPDDADTLNNRGVALTYLGQYDEALTAYNRALELRPDDPGTLNNRGNALRELKRYDEALADYDRALILRPDHPNPLNNRGNALLELKRYDEAVAAYDRALELHPDHPSILNNRAIGLRELERYDEALADYDRALILRPDHPGTLNNQGNVLRRLKRFDEALAAFDRALELRPDDPSTLYHRGNTLRDLKRHDEALAAYDRALAFRPDDPGTLYNRGCVLALTSRPDEAMAAIEAAIAHGFGDCDLLASDPHLTFLRNHPVHGPRLAVLVNECGARSG